MTRVYLHHVQRGTPGSMSFAQKLAVATDKADAENKEREKQQDAAEAQKIRSWVSGQQNKSSNASECFNKKCFQHVSTLFVAFLFCYCLSLSLNVSIGVVMD